MKNKEIEELLKEHKDLVLYYASKDKDYKNGVALFNVGKIEKILSYIEQLENENQQLKKQKDDVVDWLNNNYCYVGKKMSLKPFSDLKDLLRMLGEIDE